MDETLPTSGIFLHIWPGQWGLPSFDPLCLATVLYLQLAIPGKFTLVESSNPDASQSGQLPYLVHETFTVSSFPSIVKYVSGLRNNSTYPNANMDSQLSQSQRSQKVAWYAHAESHLGDLVYHALYADQSNWSQLTNPALASLFAVPQKYYVPRRIRAGYYPRLVAAGLWKEAAEEKSPDSPFPREVKLPRKEKLSEKTALSLAFEKEKVLNKARTDLDIYRELLEGHQYVFENRLCSVDVLVAAHIILLIKPPFSDPLLKDLITKSYPSLVAHAEHIESIALGNSSAQILYAPQTSSTLRAIFPSWPKVSPHRKTADPTPEDLHFQRVRWGFVGAAVGSLAVYLMLVGSMFEISWDDQDEEDEDYASTKRPTVRLE